MEERLKSAHSNTWMIIGIVFGVIAAALAVILICTYINMPDRDAISAEAYEEAKAEYKDQLAQVRQYYEIRLKKNTTPTSEEPANPDNTQIEPEDTKYDELYAIDIVEATPAKEYIYIPAIGKKLKIDSNLKNVKYAIYEDSIAIWGLLKDAPMSDYSFIDDAPLLTLTINSSKYVDTFIKIDPESASWLNKYKEESIILKNGNYLGPNYWETFSFAFENNTDEEWYDKSREAIQKMLYAKENYEDIE